MADSQTVLVIEDEAPMRQTLVAALQQAGINVLQASNGQEGLQTALAQHPTLILSDNLMPILNGVDMVAKLREDAWGKTASVILMTNVYDVNAVNQSLTAGITDYIMKSDVGLDQLVNMVLQRLNPQTNAADQA